MCCYVTPKEHLGLPNADDVREGIIAYKKVDPAGYQHSRQGQPISDTPPISTASSVRAPLRAARGRSPWRCRASLDGWPTRSGAGAGGRCEGQW